MHRQVVGLFNEECYVTEAARLLRGAGYGWSDLDLVSPGRLMHRPEGMWPCALKWGLIGSIVVEVPVLIWVLLAFDSWGMQLFLAVSLWKFGTLFGGMLGAIAGSDRGLESNVARRYEQHFAHGAVALAARVDQKDAPQARVIFLESGAFDIRNVDGRFIAKTVPARGDMDLERQPGSLGAGNP